MKHFGLMCYDIHMEDKKPIEIATIPRLKDESDADYVVRAEAVLAAQELKLLDFKAMRTLESIAEDEEASDNARVAAASAILNRTRGKPVEKHEHSGPGGAPIAHAVATAPVTEEQLERFVQRHAKGQTDAGG